jgi:hypothetical protein
MSTNANDKMSALYNLDDRSGNNEHFKMFFVHVKVCTYIYNDCYFAEPSQKIIPDA